jgi:hypothetical protein
LSFFLFPLSLSLSSLSLSVSLSRTCAQKINAEDYRTSPESICIVLDTPRFTDSAPCDTGCQPQIPTKRSYNPFK